MNFSGVLFFSFIAGLSTVAGVYLVRVFGAWTRRNSLYLISFAGGVLVATAFLELLPEAAVETKMWPTAALIGVVGLFVVEHFMAIHECQDETCDIHNIGTISALGIGIHSLIDGVVIGAGFQVSVALGLITAVAVIVHEVPEGVFTYGLLIASHEPERKSLIISWIVALATPVGTLLTYSALQGLGPDVLGIMLALSGGTFVYVGTADLLPQIHRRPNVKALSIMLAGVIFVVLLGYFFG
ncbi:MAG: ZIP family metal transporter [Actinomycetota bacterium]